MMNLIAELKIYGKEDRLKVATILIDNGYTVSQGKKKKSDKAVDYILKVYEDSENTNTSSK